MNGASRAKPTRGFTLIEAIAATVLLAVAVPPMISAVTASAIARQDPVNISRARWLAAERLEDVIADRHSSSRGYAYVTNANYGAESSVSGFTNFSRSVSIVETGASLSGAGTGYKRVTVTVGWMSPRFGTQTLALSTVVTDYTP